jgi:diacylglycerol kinase (ATP)
MRYTTIDIIFNPNSTGKSDVYAKTLKGDLVRVFPKLPIKVHATKYAGHAEKIAYKCAFSSKKPLLISVSGDGGYHEVINGALKAQLTGAKPICAVLAAGNANDHSRTLQKQPLVKAIEQQQVRNIDLLKATIESGTMQVVRYAHSYVGLGLTPVVAVELNKTTLNAYKEAWLALKIFFKFRPFKIKRGSKILRLDSILFTNISQMAKILKVAKHAQPDDGLFEVITFRHVHKFVLFQKLLKAATTGIHPRKHYQQYEFIALKSMPAQFDGEVLEIPKGSVVTITNENRLLSTIL